LKKRLPKPLDLMTRPLHKLRNALKNGGPKGKAA
jgi:hypothetical protein